ncbi:glycosyltransferase [Phytohabitans sp. ZYX-F-186]|uniref:Glycosyltransferase n=1 Tax=Phytohabitans maris TaxID=3071409 RepID=A0ABU0ZIK4_9ACTN|nr:glycosyltransferase [Phytohabitans sp. ZYX-F-186]MDQ7905782.1 glycosyltransferase [Phytohabitans sp. ZYX-F-186]
MAVQLRYAYPEDTVTTIESTFTMSAPTGVDRIPAVVRDVDVAGPLPTIPGSTSDGHRVERVWLLVRAFTEPVGSLDLALPAWGLAPDRLAAAIDRDLGPAIRERVRAGGGDLDGPLTAAGVRVPGQAPFLAGRARVLRDAPPITVVVCTRDHPEELARCLDSLLAQEYPRFRVLVVDNAPSTNATARVVAAAARRGPVDYLLAPEPGLSRARNAAVAAAPGEILAWTDDDVVADPHWLAEVARALAEHPEAGVVSGVVVPAQLATPAEVWFEQYGGHSKGRGFTPAVFSPATAHEQSPLYPLPPFGVGANMTFRPGVIESIGGFDPALGAGSTAMGGEDTLAFTRVLLDGGTIAYQPTALVRHYHRPDLEGLRRQLVGYGTGLTAAYTSLLLSRPRTLGALLRLAPTALRDILGPSPAREVGLRDDFPRELLSANRRGMVRGPLAYLRGRRREKSGQG